MNLMFLLGCYRYTVSSPALAATVSIKRSKLALIPLLIAVCCNAERVSADPTINNAALSSQTQLVQNPDEWWLRVYGGAFYLGFTDSADLAPSCMLGLRKPVSKKNRKGISRRVTEFQTFATDFWNSKAECDRFVGAFKTGYADGCGKGKTLSTDRGGLSAFDGSLAQASSINAKDALFKQANRLRIQKSRATYLVQLVLDDMHRPHSKLLEPQQSDMAQFEAKSGI